MRGPLAITVLVASMTLHAAAGAAQESRLELADGTALAMTTMGTGPTLLVLHGGPSLGHRYLVEAFEGLAADYTVVLYDQRGTGRSGPEGAPRSGLARLIGDVDGVSDVLGADQIVLIGHSWGAHLAMSYAVDDPDRLEGLVLVSPAEPGSRFADLQTANLERNTTAEDSSEVARIFTSEAFEQGSVSTMDRLSRAMYRPWFAQREDVGSLHVGLDRAEVERARATGARLAASDGAGATWSALGRIVAPTLVLHGAEDIVPLEMARALSDSIRDARLEVMEGVGHFPMLEEPDLFVDRIRAFLERIGW